MDIAVVKKMMFRAKKSHKGEHGSVLVVGGSEDYVGTLVLVGLAALRAGCDIVRIAAPEKVAWAINCYSPDLITKKLPGTFLTARHLTAVKQLLLKSDVIELGNGIRLKKETKQFCKKLVKLTKEKLKVIDADGIKLLSLQEMSNSLITPHTVELKILLENSGLDSINEIKNKNKKARELQKHVGTNVLLVKGLTDYVISRTKIKKITGGNPGMARAGMGDVLAGLCAGFLAQTGDLFASAEAASFVNKRMGDLLLRKKKGYSFIASDMIEEMKRLLPQQQL